MRFFFLACIAMSTPAQAQDDLFSSHSVQVKDKSGKPVTITYRLLRPAKIEEGKKYPLVLFLHGAGERGSDNKKQLKYFPTQMASKEWREKFPCYLIAPQCPSGKRWVEKPWGAKKSEPMDKASSPAMQGAIQALENTIRAFPVDRSRIYLTGLSMGGYGSWELAARAPKLFAAVVPICGGGDERQAKTLATIPIWAFHGDKDRAVPVSRSRMMVKAIKEAGGKLIEYTEYKGGGHNVWTRAYSEKDGVVFWMFSKRLAKKK